jgi:AraC-like DNA-binding protein
MNPIDYREGLPPAVLRPYIQCFWQLQGRAEDGQLGVERVLPDGRVEIVFNCGDVVKQFGHGEEPSVSPVIQPSVIVVGVAERALLIRPTGRIDCFGVRFRRGGASAMLRVDARELTNAVVDLFAVRTLFPRSFHERVSEAHDFASRVGLVVDRLTRQVAGASFARSAVEVAVDAIEETHGAIDIADAARRANVGVRQLERRFLQEIGVGPKLLARLVRFSGLVRHLAACEPMPLARLAAQMGYHDQSHLARDFREFAGRSAFAYLRETHDWSDRFFGSEPDAV